jgi:hypothetical protein
VNDPQAPGSRRKWVLGAAVGALVAAVVVVVLLASGSGSRGHRTIARQTTSAPAPTSTAPPARPPAAPGPPALPPPSGQQLGANVNWLFNDRSYPQQLIEPQLRELRASGATVARSDALWEYAEPAPPVNGVHRYQWAFDDAIARSLAATGLRWFPIVDYAPSWATVTPDQPHSPPRSIDDFASFAAALATRYGQGGSFWRAHPELPLTAADTYEIWNEPDGSFWPPAPDARAYAELYLRARDAIRTVDPSARVIVGGLSAPESFLPQLLAQRPDLRGHIDGVAIHPYGGTPFAVLARVRTARRTLQSLRLGSVPLYATEFGWTTRPRGAYAWLSPRRRPGYIEATLAALGHLDCGLVGTFVYTWVTPEHDPLNPEEWYGIHPPGGGTTRDSVAFAAGIRKALAPGATIQLCARG